MVFLDPKKHDFAGWCGKKNTGVVFAVRDTSNVLECHWSVEHNVPKSVKKKFKKKSVQNGSGVEKKRSGVKIAVQKFCSF